MINVLAVTGQGEGGLAKASFNNTGTSWKHPLGYHINTGIGVSFMMKNRVGFEADFKYDLNHYIFIDQGIKLNLGYSLPGVDLKVKKVFRSEENISYFIRMGVGFSFGGIASKSKDNTFYSYQMNLVSTSSLLFIPEIGVQHRINKKSYINYSLIYQYGTNTMFTNTMNYWYDVNNGPIETASSSTRGNYLGIQIKYFYIAKEYSKKIGSERSVPDERF